MSSAPTKEKVPETGAKDEKKEDAAKAVEEKVEAKPMTVEEEILYNISLIGRAVSTIEPRFTARVLRTLTTLRRKLTKSAMKAVLNQAFPEGSKTGQSLIASSFFDSLPETAAASSDAKSSEASGMDIDQTPAETAATAAASTSEAATGAKKFSPPLDGVSQDLIPEAVAYLRLLLILMNLDAGKVEEAGTFAMETTEICGKANRRTLDQLSSKVYFYLARSYELQGRLAELQPMLLAARQTASLRQDENLEASLINLLLRSYLAQHQYDQADKLIARSTFPSAVSQAQTARWLFYAGRLRAVQLNYAQARDYLQTAIRRAPRDEVAPGFVQMVHKYYIVVVLLTGVIPDRSTFRKPVLKQALAPYFQVVQAVRVGDVSAFQKALSEHEKTFHADSTHFLILRLRHFVIKTALRTITLAYSRISLRDVCAKLRLDSEEDTEYIVAKAIKDGVIDASIDHAGGFMQSKVAKDVYETDEPAKEFNARVDFCTQVYNDSVRAMRYPPNAHRKALDSADESRERDREIAQLLEMDDEMDDM
ncbi:proteasome regulatory subunit C-terminal-domain-containing protein [Dioszegia hungarica]|uniref:Proteasome regulatory subunit C-terminal-domain-containing protein n=1 Tax=Dioszegia hungarica TaxID=4972 RepID=A0AA38HF60_9TREE|nr:proteasome regulatory subunit C-terminal-domain-containing protein [Dioszegia hungarica]KAI9639580.1 proteasome regulatory subunit C-terminal-domain-containing protein [Dioszegia hungarica]